MQQRFLATVRVDVWTEDETYLKAVVVSLDSPFTYQQLSTAGTAIQAGAWEALKKAIETILAQTSRTSETPPETSETKENTNEFRPDD